MRNIVKYCRERYKWTCIPEVNYSKLLRYLIVHMYRIHLLNMFILMFSFHYINLREIPILIYSNLFFIGNNMTKTDSFFSIRYYVWLPTDSIASNKISEVYIYPIITQYITVSEYLGDVYENQNNKQCATRAHYSTNPSNVCSSDKSAQLTSSKQDLHKRPNEFDF
jgi:hypothetical protein